MIKKDLTQILIYKKKIFLIKIMLIGLLSSFIKGLIDLGGINKVLEINWKYNRIEFFE